MTFANQHETLSLHITSKQYSPNSLLAVGVLAVYIPSSQDLAKLALGATVAEKSRRSRGGIVRVPGWVAGQLHQTALDKRRTWRSKERFKRRTEGSKEQHQHEEQHQQRGKRSGRPLHRAGPCAAAVSSAALGSDAAVWEGRH